MTPLCRLSLLIFALVTLLVLAACGDGGPELDTSYPSAGEDRFEQTTATVELEVTVPGLSPLPVAIQDLETVELEGPAVIDRGNPQDEDGDGRVEIETEIVSMELTGVASFGPVTVRQSPDRPSTGMVEQQEPGQDFPADSFFDVFVEVEIMDLGLLAHNEEPLRMEAELTDLPPGEDDEYLDALGRPLPIVTEQGIEIGRIVDALHIPNPPPSPPGATPEAKETPEATPTEAPTPTPTEEPAPPGVSGARHCGVTVSEDPAGHAPFIGMPPSLELDVRQVDSAIDIMGPPPWVDVSGDLLDGGGIMATGMGEVAGFPDIAVDFQGGIFEDGGLNGVYTMGAAGGLPQGQPIQYQVDCLPSP